MSGGAHAPEDSIDVVDTATMLVKVSSGKKGAKLKYLLEKRHQMHRDLSA